MQESGQDRNKWRLTLRPRDWQDEAIRLWKAAGNRGIVSVVTGAGKTALAMLCMNELRQHQETVRFLIIVPTIALLDQWFISLRDDLGVDESDIALYSGESHSEQPRLVNLAVINTARTVAATVSRQSQTFLIVDECHRAASPLNAEALAGEYVATLGMSATPERDYDEGFEEVLVPTLGPIIYRYSYADAVQDGVVVPFELINVSVELNPLEQRRYNALSRKVAATLSKLKKTGEGQEHLKRILQERASVSANARVRIPAAISLVERQPGARTIIFHERVSAANELWRSLRQRNHRVALYHSQMGPDIRRDNLRLFRKGVFDILITCRALDEGINVPETTVAILASSTASIRQRIQRLGRVLRPAKDKSEATIYTFYATDVEEHRLKEEAQRLAELTTVTWLRSYL